MSLFFKKETGGEGQDRIRKGKEKKFKKEGNRIEEKE